MKMKNLTVLIIIIALIATFSAAVSADYYTGNYSTYRSNMPYSIIQVEQLRYDPYPVSPGNYFDLYIKAENMGNKDAEDATFELITEYPFFLDANEDPVRSYGSLGPDEPVVLEYKVRVDKDAVDGPNEIKLRYTSDGDGKVWIDKTFEIEVDDAQTDFDLVIQEITGNEVVIAIANTGINIANSVIVKVPEQESYQVIGTAGQMVGNLEDGDYTLVSFEISAKARTAAKSFPLKLQIDYTDNIGERRSVIKEVSYSVSTAGNFSSESGAQFSRSGTSTTQTAIYQKWWFWVIIIAAAYALFRLYKEYKKRKEALDEKRVKHR